MRARELDVIFVGGGLASVLAALALRSRQPHLRLAILERAASLGGNHTWCFHAADVPDEAWSFVGPLVVQRWPGHCVRFPRRSRRLASAYACITSARLHEVTLDALGADVLLQATAAQVTADAVTLADGRSLRAPLIVDARGPSLEEAREARGYQKFVGLELMVEPSAHLPAEPLLFDACIAQHDGFRFMYSLPLAPDRLLIEETFFSESPVLHEDQSVRAILAYAEERGLRVRDVQRIERGVLPMPWRDDDFDPARRPLRAGYAAGLFHPVTGYSVPMAVRFALSLAASDLKAPTLAAVVAFAREHAAQRPFLRLLTRLLFTGFEPAARFQVLEHFYRLPEPLIARFYAGQLSRVDRARIFLGAPPRGFSVGRALGAVT